MDGDNRTDAPPFDESHYRRQLPQPPGTPDLLAHYRAEGWRLGLDPHPLFDTRFYLAHAGDVARSGLDPLSHFMAVGAAAGLPFHPCFDVAHYHQQLATGEQAVNPLLHYLEVGARRGLVPCEVFDRARYLESAGGDPAAAADPLGHYLTEGWRRGLVFHPYFDADWYAAQPGAGTHSPIPLVDFLLSAPALRPSPQAFADPAFGRGLLAAGICPHVDAMVHGPGHGARLNDLRSDGWFARDGGSAIAYFAGRARHRAAGRRRVVFVGHDALRLGAQMLLLRIVEHAAASGLVEPFTILAGDGPLVDAYARAGHVVQARIGEKPEAIVRRLLARLADDPPVGAVVSTVVLPDYVAALAAAGVPPDVLVFESAEMYPVETQTEIARNARRLIFASRDTEDRFRRRVPGSYRGDVIYAGATLTPILAPEPEGGPVVLGCGTITWRKGVDRFVEVARRTIAAIGDEIPVRFVWVGTRLGPDHSQGSDFWAEYDAERSGLGDRLQFVGEVADTRPYYAGAAVMLSTARADPFPGVVIEAMASARPVIAFAGSGGAPEALEGGAGIVVPYGDTAAMADALIALLRSPEERQRIGRAARDRVAGRFRYPDYTAAILAPLVPGLRAEAMAGTVMTPVGEPVAAPPSAPPMPSARRGLDPARESVLVVADGRDPDAALLALNLAAFLRRRHNLVLMLCDGQAHVAVARATADVLMVADAAMLRDVRGLTQELHRAVDEFALHRALLVGSLPPAVPAILAGRFLPTVLVPVRRPLGDADEDAILWTQAVVSPTPTIARAVVKAAPGRSPDDLRTWPVGRSRIWTDAGPDRIAAAERLKAGLAPVGDPRLLVLGSGPPTLEGGIDLFLRIAARVTGPAAPRFAWICAPGTGAGPEWLALRRRIARSARHRHVQLWPAPPTLQPAYDAAGLFLATGTDDHLPLAAVGAIEHGLPVVAFSGDGALAELLGTDPGAAAGLVPPLDTVAAAALVGHLATHAPTRERMAAAARRLAAGFVAMPDWADRLDRLAAGRQPAIAAERRDVETILADPAFDAGECAGDVGADRLATARRHVRSWRCGQGWRRPAPGVHPGMLPARDGVDPYAAHVRAGRPDGRGQRPLIRPARPEPERGGPAAALHIHLFHAEQIGDLLRRIAVNGRRCDLILTTDTAQKARRIEWATAGVAHRRLRILVLPNRGRDIGAFLTGVAPLLGEYEVIGHVHAKQTEHKARHLVERWRERLLQFLIGDAHPMMDRILGEFAADSRLGLVYPDDPNLLGWAHPKWSDSLPVELRDNRPAALALAARLGWDDLPEAFDFPVGSMFWARTAALRPLFDLRLGWDDYPAEPVPENGTMLHALERLFCLVAERAGYRIAASHVPGFPR